MKLIINVTNAEHERFVLLNKMTFGAFSPQLSAKSNQKNYFDSPKA